MQAETVWGWAGLTFLSGLVHMLNSWLGLGLPAADWDDWAVACEEGGRSPEA